jgi:hypothetical protein
LTSHAGIGTFIIDFQSTNFGYDSKIALDMLHEFQKPFEGTNPRYQNQELFVLDPPISSAGWSFAKLFIAGQFIERLYHMHSEKIEKSKGKNLEDKIVSWLAKELEGSQCQAKIKIAREMRI